MPPQSLSELFFDAAHKTNTKPNAASPEFVFKMSYIVLHQETNKTNNEAAKLLAEGNKK
jgi:hypothetical protein